MTTETLLSRLEGVKRTGPDRWLAKCPAHEDRRPSLSVRALADGRILIHDFGGCGTDAVLAAAGLEMGDLFPERIDKYDLPKPPRIPAGDVLQAIGTELEVVVIAARDLAEDRVLDAGDHARLLVAADRLRKALSLANGSR